jgi:hypothetical protein
MAQTVTNMTSARKVCSSNLDWVTEHHDSFIQALLTVPGWYIRQWPFFFKLCENYQSFYSSTLYRIGCWRSRKLNHSYTYIVNNMRETGK